MKKFSKNILLACLLGSTIFASTDHENKNRESVSLSIRASLSDPYLKDVIHAKNPKIFKGIDPELEGVVKTFREQPGSLTCKITKPNNEIMAFMKKHIEAAGLPANGETILQMWCNTFYQLACLSKNPDALEKDVFSNLEHNRKFYRRMSRMTDAKPENTLENFMNIGRFSSDHMDEDFYSNKHDYFLKSISGADSYQLVKKLDKEKWFLEHVPYFYSGGEIGLATITYLAMGDCHVIGLTKETVHVHGMNMSPLALAVHDKEHASLIEDGRNQLALVLNVLKSLKFKDEDVNIFFDLPIAVDPVSKDGTYVKDLLSMRYNRTMGVFKHVMDSLYPILINGNQEMYLRYLVPMFVMMHEQSDIPADVYSFSDPKVVFHRLIKNGRRYIRYITLKETLYDLKTSYIDGSSPLSDTEILKTMLPGVEKNLTNTKYFPNDDQTFAQWLANNLSEFKANRGPSSIKLQIKLFDGSHSVVDSQTNNFLWGFNKDSRKLLNMAGLGISDEPELTGDFQTDSKNVRVYYSELVQKFEDLFDELEVFADDVFDKGFAANYRTEVEAEEYMLNNAMTELKKQTKAKQAKNFSLLGADKSK